MSSGARFIYTPDFGAVPPTLDVQYEAADGSRTLLATFDTEMLPPTRASWSPGPSTMPGLALGEPAALSFGSAHPAAFSHVAGELPPGLELGEAGDLAGTPVREGTHAFTLRVERGGEGADKAFTLAVAERPEHATAALLPTAARGAECSALLRATTHGATFSVVAGELPDGVALAPDGALSGSPALVGDAVFTVRAASAAAPADVYSDLEFTLAVAELPVAWRTAAGLPPSEAYGDVWLRLSADGAEEYAVVAGAPPAGLALSSEGVLSGTAAAEAGAHAFTVRASSAAGAAEREFVMEVTPIARLRAVTESRGVSSGGSTLFYITAAGDVHGAGYNEDGHLTGTPGNRQNAMMSIPGLSGVFRIAESYGSTFKFALDDVGDWWMQGQVNGGDAGDGTTVKASFPAQRWTAVPDAARIVQTLYSSWALNSGGEWYRWGRNAYGSVADGSKVVRPTPARFDALEDVRDVIPGYFCNLFLNEGGDLYGAGFDWQEAKASAFVVMSGVAYVLSAGLKYPCAVVRRADGTLWGWGTARFRSLPGVDVEVSWKAPVRLVALEALEATSPVRAVTGNIFSSMVLLENGDVYGSGQVSYWTNHNPTKSETRSLEKLSGLPAIRHIVTDGSKSFAYVTADGRVFTSGINAWHTTGFTDDGSIAPRELTIPGGLAQQPAPRWLSRSAVPHVGLLGGGKHGKRLRADFGATYVCPALPSGLKLSRDGLLSGCPLGEGPHALTVRAYGEHASVRYPPRPLASAFDAVEGEAYGNGTYTASGSAGSSSPAWGAFGGGGGWSAAGYGGGGGYAGGATLGGHSGEHVILDLPAPVSPRGATVRFGADPAEHGADIVVLGGDGVSWDEIGRAAGNAAATADVALTPLRPYRRLAVVVVATGGAAAVRVVDVSFLAIHVGAPFSEREFTLERTEIKRIASNGETYMLVLLTDGTVHSLGESPYSLGNGPENTSYSAPTRISGLSDIVDVACLSGAYRQVNVALDAYGRVWGWGSNKDDSSTGTGDTVDLHYPVVNQHLPGRAASIHGSMANIWVVMEGTGEVWGWGEDDFTLGNSVEMLVPKKVPGLTGVVKIASGSKTVAVALTASGETWTFDTFTMERDVDSWRSYQLGTGKTTETHVPALLSTGIVDIAERAGAYQLTADGRVLRNSSEAPYMETPTEIVKATGLGIVALFGGGNGGWVLGLTSAGDVVRLIGHDIHPTTCPVPLRKILSFGPGRGDVYALGADGLTYSNMRDGIWSHMPLLDELVSPTAPPRALSAAHDVVAGERSGNGLYRVSASSGEHAFRAFSVRGGSGAGWTSAAGKYGGDGAYSGSAGMGGRFGEFLLLEVPAALDAHTLSITVADDAALGALSVLGSEKREGGGWMRLAYVADASSARADYGVRLAAVGAHRRFAVVFESTAGGEAVSVRRVALLSRDERSAFTLPQRPLTGPEDVVVGEARWNGPHAAGASSAAAGAEAWRATLPDGVGWRSGPAYAPDGSYTGSSGLDGRMGEWWSLDAPEPVAVSSFTWTADDDEDQYGRTPAALELLATNDGAAWTTLAEVSVQSGAVAGMAVRVQSTARFARFAIVVTKNGGHAATGVRRVSLQAEHPPEAS